MLKDIPLAAITIGERFRKDLGDIAGLAASIATVGLLHPILVTTDYALIVGRRRLAAYHHLGRETIPAVVLDLEDVLQAELDENHRRLNFTPSEKIALTEAIADKVQAQKALNQKQGKRLAPSDKLSQGQPGDTRDLLAAQVGWSGMTYEKAKIVVEAAKQDPELQELVEQMDRTGKVSAAYRDIPPYIFIERPDLAPKTKPTKPRILSFNTLMQRLDKLVIETVLPQAECLNDEYCANFRKLLESYLAMLDQITAERRGTAAEAAAPSPTPRGHSCLWCGMTINTTEDEAQHQEHCAAACSEAPSPAEYIAAIRGKPRKLASRKVHCNGPRP